MTKLTTIDSHGNASETTYADQAQAANGFVTALMAHTDEAADAGRVTYRVMAGMTRYAVRVIGEEGSSMLIVRANGAWRAVLANSIAYLAAMNGATVEQA